MAANDKWSFFTIGVWVTGRGEREFLPAFLRSLADTGRCHILVKGRIGQLDPRSAARQLVMVGKGRPLSTRQAEFAQRVRGFLEQSPLNLAVVVDDLEERRNQHQEVFDTYRQPLDRMLQPRGLQTRASVHFLVPMIEAYFLADSAALTEILVIEIPELEGDAESIRGAKGKLKRHYKDAGLNYNERTSAEQIAGQVDLEKVLGHPDHCVSLRTLVKWCSRRIGDEDSDRFQLRDGVLCSVTAGQIEPAVTE